MNTQGNLDGTMRNQIDHVLLEKKHERLMAIVRTCCGADTDLDHISTIPKIRHEIPPKNRIKDEITI